MGFWNLRPWLCSLSWQRSRPVRTTGERSFKLAPSSASAPGQGRATTRAAPARRASGPRAAPRGDRADNLNAVRVRQRSRASSPAPRNPAVVRRVGRPRAFAPGPASTEEESDSGRAPASGKPGFTASSHGAKERVGLVEAPRVMAVLHPRTPSKSTHFNGARLMESPSRQPASESRCARPGRLARARHQKAHTWMLPTVSQSMGGSDMPRASTGLWGLRPLPAGPASPTAQRNGRVPLHHGTAVL